MLAPLPWLSRTRVNRLPLLFKGISRTLPFAMQKHYLLNILNQVFGDLITNGELDFLFERRVLIWVSDSDIRWNIGMEQQQFTINRSAHADTIIRGELATFILLASRKVDPDTLFFQRRLNIEGDTDLGLALKNVLDTLEPEVLPLYLRTVLDWLAGQYM